jgi:hypothetical protein
MCLSERSLEEAIVYSVKEITKHLSLFHEFTENRKKVQVRPNLKKVEHEMGSSTGLFPEMGLGEMAAMIREMKEYFQRKREIEVEKRQREVEVVDRAVHEAMKKEAEAAAAKAGGTKVKKLLCSIEGRTKGCGKDRREERFRGKQQHLTKKKFRLQGRTCIGCEK